jgi:G protein-coupled receptor GPR1
MVAENVSAEPPQTVDFAEPIAPLYKPGSCTTIPAMFPVSRKALAAAGSPSSSQESSSSSQESASSSPYPGQAAPAPHIPHDPLTSHVSRNRDKIRRQLRSLFVYPLLYLLTWIFPLVNHAYGYASDSPRPPWILVLSLVSLAIQGAADSAVFTAREKPWRHTAAAGFWVSFRGGWWDRRTDGMGPTREEMLVEERIARARRKAEMMDEVGREKKRQVGQRRHWWDVKDYEAAADGGPRGMTRENL